MVLWCRSLFPVRNTSPDLKSPWLPATITVVADHLAEGPPEGFTCLPWPLQQLKCRVLVKGKKLPAARNEDGRILSDREDEDEDEEEAEEALETAEQRKRVSVTGSAGWVLLQRGLGGGREGWEGRVGEGRLS